MGNLGRAGYGASLDGMVRRLLFCIRQRCSKFLIFSYRP